MKGRRIKLISKLNNSMHLLIEHWDELNTLDIFTQIGALAPLGQPRAQGGPQ